MTPLRALLVGAGGWGRRWAGALNAAADVELAGWVDTLPGASTMAADALGLGEVWTGTDLSSAIEAVAPDFVVDVAHPEAHYDVTMLALNAGLPVLGEKPMADSMAHARAMVAASERAGKLFMVSQSRRYDENLMALRGLIVGDLGGLGMLHADFARGIRPGGFREEMASPLLVDMSIHTFDAARYLSGCDPVAVYCAEYNPAWSWFRGNASATAIFEMTEGVHFSYRGTWTAHGFKTPWESLWRAVGPRGTALWDGRAAPMAEVVVEEGGEEAVTAERTAMVPRGVTRDIEGSLEDFVRALRTGTTPMGECHDNIKSFAMICAAMESAHTGRCVALEL